jgi:SAM-dependent MidA family methyltransferase
MTYDAASRRATPLAMELTERIRRSGPISVHDYMTSCLYDPVHGFYRSRTAIGQEGDFITAPEISQVFGELIGLWTVVVRQQMGWPERLTLVELGPGRGTLMRDALRAVRSVPGALNGLDVALVEVNPTLADLQRTALAGCGVPVVWHSECPALAGGVAIVIANEFLDCVPVHQWVRTPDGCAERRVGLDTDGRLAFVAGPEAPPPPHLGALADVPVDEVVEWAEFASIQRDLVRLRARAALFIDYGDDAGPQRGDSLQAVRRHQMEHPLTSPGEADLTAQVDFRAFRADLTRSGEFTMDGPVTQSVFLGRLGAVERASRLMSANPALAGSIETGVARLLSPVGMGSRFKCAALRSGQLPTLPAFD